MPIVEAEGDVSARRDGDVVDFLQENCLVKLLLAECLSGKLPERILVDAVIAAGVRGSADEKVVLFAGSLFPSLPAIVVSTNGALDLAGEAGHIVPLHGMVPAVG